VEKAEVNLPIEDGYALATEEGRAEVEFESGSMVYVAPHSVVLFDQLLSTGHKFETQLKLVTGTMKTTLA
jgi:FecR protein